MPRLLGGFVSPSLRWWPSWWWSLHLRSFRCRLLDDSQYTRPTYVVQIEPTQTTPKPLQTLAFIGVSQPHDGDTKTADATATTSRTPQPRHATATSRRPHPGTPRHPGHDGHSHVVTTTATTCTDMIAYKGTCPRDTTRHATRQPNKHSSEQTFDRTHVPMLHIRQTPGWGSVPPGQKTGAACSLVLTLNARWNIFGLPVTHEVFTYLVVATVVAPYILCIMFLGLMLMAVKLA